MTKHTEKPWKVYFPKEIDRSIQIKLGSFESDLGYKAHHLIEYAEAYSIYSGEQKEEAKANAQLIAAAPELLEIAEEYLSMFESFDDHMPESTKKHKEKIKSVVEKAKAEGDSNE